MYNLVLLLMGVVIFISFKNNKNILLKNIFIRKDVDLNSKKQRGVILFPFEWRARGCTRSSPSICTPALPLAGAACTPVASLPSLRAAPACWPACQPRVPLAAASGTGLAAFDVAWGLLLSKELPLQIQIRPILSKWS